MIIANCLHLVKIGEIIWNLTNEESAQLTFMILAESLLTAHFFAQDFRFAGERSQLVALVEVTFFLLVISGLVLKQRSLSSEMILHPSKEHIRIGARRLLRNLLLLLLLPN